MEGNSPKIEWYLARDGEQHGPLSDTELRKFVELGHLRESDLLWRAGFTEWQQAFVVFPPADHATPAPGSIAPDTRAPERRGERSEATPRRGPLSRRDRSAPEPVTSRDDDGGIEVLSEQFGTSNRTRTERRGAQSRSGAVRAVAGLLLMIALAAGAWLAWENRDKLGSATGFGSLVATASNNSTDGSLRVSPFVISGTSAEAIEASLQRSAVWRLAKRDFPQWYAERTQELGKLVSENADEKVVARLLAESLVALRREHAAAALSAPLPALRKLATSFVDNLSELSKLGPNQCFGFISFGEGTPLVVELSRTPAHAEHLQRQMVAVFEAVGEGRRTQFTHAQARRADYDMLSWELAKRNWTREDLVTFSDPRRLAALPPEGVCKMVQDWFSAQIDIADEDVQARLLANSLKPLVQG